MVREAMDRISEQGDTFLPSDTWERTALKDGARVRRHPSGKLADIGIHGSCPWCVNGS